MRRTLHLRSCIAVIVLAACAETNVTPTDAVAPRALSFATAASNVVNVSNVTALRSAIANAAPNTTINIAAGTYDLGDNGIQIDDKSGLEIYGAGRTKTIIRTGHRAAYGFELKGRVSNLTVAHLAIAGASPADTNTHALAGGPYRMSMTGLRYFDLDISNVAVGISVLNSSIDRCSDVQVTGNYVHNVQEFFKPDGTTPGSGYGIHNDGCTNVRIADNVISDADRHSIYQARGYQDALNSGPGTIVIEHNLIIDHAKTSTLNAWYLVALVVARSSNVVVANNVIVNPYHDAFSIETANDDRTYTVNDVRFINNTVLGPRDYDVYLEAGGNYTFWGNRFIHRDATSTTLTPTVRRMLSGVNGTLAEPTPYQGTQALSSSAPFTTMFGMVKTVLGKGTPVYNTDPAAWPMTANTAIRWPLFEDLASNGGLAYVVNDRRLVEVDGSTWAQRPANWTFPAPTSLGWSDDGLIALSDNHFYKFDLKTLKPSLKGAPGSGAVNGMAVFGGSAYLMRGNCFYEVSTSNFSSTSMGC